MGLLVNDGRLKRGASPLAGIAFYQGPRKPNQNKPLKRPIMRSLTAPFPRRAAASSNHLAGVGAGRTPEFIEMKQAGVSHSSASARLVGR